MMTMLPKPNLKTKLGSLYEGDCLKLLPEIKDGSVDLVFADPPFNLGKVYRSKMNDELSAHEYLEWCRSWCDELVRVLKPGGSFFLYSLPKWNLPIGAYLGERLTFRHWIAIDMKYTLPIPKRLYPSHYSLLYFVKGDRPSIFRPDRLPVECCRHCGGEIPDYGGYKDKMNPKGVSLTDVWTDIPPVRHSKYKTRKANELSIKLLDRVLNIASDEGSLVLDPFGGAGTTYVAAELLGRRWIGTELHCEDILARFRDISTDRIYIEKLSENKNVLFTSENLKLRRKSGQAISSKYRVDRLNSPTRIAPFTSEPSLFDERQVKAS